MSDVAGLGDVAGDDVAGVLVVSPHGRLHIVSRILRDTRATRARVAESHNSAQVRRTRCLVPVRRGWTAALAATPAGPPNVCDRCFMWTDEEIAAGLQTVLQRRRRVTYTSREDGT